MLECDSGLSGEVHSCHVVVYLSEHCSTPGMLRLVVVDYLDSACEVAYVPDASCGASCCTYGVGVGRVVCADSDVTPTRLRTYGAVSTSYGDATL